MHSRLGCCEAVQLHGRLRRLYCRENLKISCNVKLICNMIYANSTLTGIAIQNFKFRNFEEANPALQGYSRAYLALQGYSRAYLALQGYSRAHPRSGHWLVGFGRGGVVGFTPHQTTPNPTKNLFSRAHLLGKNKEPCDAWLSS